MKARTLFALTVVALLMTAGTATAVVLGSPDIDATLSDNTVSPGEAISLEVVLVNTGDLTSGSNVNPALNDEVTTAQGVVVDVRSGDTQISDIYRVPIQITTEDTAVLLAIGGYVRFR